MALGAAAKDGTSMRVLLVTWAGNRPPERALALAPDRLRAPLEHAMALVEAI